MSAEGNPARGGPPPGGATRAVILAAGVGRRLGAAHTGPKALLSFGGRTLIERHVHALRTQGVGPITIVLGHDADALRDHAATLGTDLDFVFNPEYRRGSLVSLACAAGSLRAGDEVVLMDADVLYEVAVLARLWQGGGGECFLVDRTIEPGDEPVKLCISDGAIVDFAKRPEMPHQWHGESVGFFRFTPTGAAELAARAEARLAAGSHDAEYETVIRDMILAGPAERFSFADVTGLAWTEIDFAEDVERARALLHRVDAAAGQLGRPS